MGQFTDLLDRERIGTHPLHEGSLEHRVEVLEDELKKTQRLVKILVVTLEQSLGESVAANLFLTHRLM